LGRRATAALLVALLGGLLTGCDPIPASGWQVRLATANAAGTDGGNVATAAIPVVSEGGTKVAFATPASNLGPTDTNSALDVYVLDLEADTTVLASGNAAGTDAGNSGSTSPALSPDGTKVAFVSSATDLGPADADQESDVYVRDLRTGAVTRVKPAPDACGDAHSDGPVFSPDGSKLAFVRRPWAELLGSALYVHDLESGATSLAAPHADGSSCGVGEFGAAEFSPDGTRVVFETTANDLGPTDTNGGSSEPQDLYLRDLTTGTTSLVTANATGTDSGNGASSQPDFSPDGTKVAFTSRAGDLSPTDTNLSDDVYLRDLTTGTTSLVSVNAAGTGAGNGLSGGRPTFSPDGTRIGFTSFGSNFGPQDTNGLPDVYVRDLTTETTTLASPNAAGTSGSNGFPVFHGFVGGSDRVVFRTTASNMGPADGNGRADIYVRDLASGTTTLVSANEAGTSGGNGESAFAAASPGGPTIAFLSIASDLGPSDANGLRDVYVALYHDRADLTTALAADPQPVATGGQLTYRASVTNAGPEAAQNAALALTLPAGASYLGSTGDCSPPASGEQAVVGCTLGALDPGGTAEVEIDVTVTAGAGTTLEATAIAASTTFDPDGTGNRASVTVDVVAPPEP
jgi:uncharacterized repeat protein (TIGR01451 family)